MRVEGGEGCLVTVAVKPMWEGCCLLESSVVLPWRPRLHTVLLDLAQDGRAQAVMLYGYINTSMHVLYLHSTKWPRKQHSPEAIHTSYTGEDSLF